MTEDEVVGWHHQLNECELEQTLEDSEGQGHWAEKGGEGRQKVASGQKAGQTLWAWMSRGDRRPQA